MNQTKRDNYYDYLRGIAIFLVFLGHSLQYGHGESYLHSQLFWQSPYMKVIYSFHMALFVLISGYFSFFSIKRHGNLPFIKKRLILSVPNITWTAVLMVMMKVIGRNVYPIDFIRNMFDCFWFLWTILFSSLLLTFIEFIIPKKLRLISYIAIFFIFLFTPDGIWLYAHKYMFYYFVFGYYAGKMDFFQQLKNKKICMISFLTWAFLLLFYNKESYIYTSKFSLLNRGGYKQSLHIFGVDAFRFIIGFAGCFFIISITLLLWNKINHDKNCLTNTLVILGRNSLPLYIISRYIYSYGVYRLPIPVQPMLITSAILSIIMLGICYLFYLIINRNKLLSFLVIGKS